MQTEPTISRLLEIRTESLIQPVFSQAPVWRQKLVAWCRLKRLEYELWQSRKFQADLQKMHYPTLALEQAALREQIERQIADLQTSTLNAEPRPLTTNR